MSALIVMHFRMTYNVSSGTLNSTTPFRNEVHLNNQVITMLRLCLMFLEPLALQLILRQIIVVCWQTWVTVSLFNLHLIKRVLYLHCWHYSDEFWFSTKWHTHYKLQQLALHWRMLTSGWVWVASSYNYPEPRTISNYDTQNHHTQLWLLHRLSPWDVPLYTFSYLTWRV